jgi:aryl-alcohol dehydrogenase-like predicted oxidoreductase
MALQYVNFGTGGVKVSRMALGLGFRGQNDSGEGERAIRTALDGGLNLIDCANVYGYMDDRANIGSSEKLLGKVLKGRRDDVVITSKVRSPIGPGPNDEGLSRYHIMREVERSLTRLDTDRIDVYLLHHVDDTVSQDEQFRACDDLVRHGKVRYVGVCNHQAWQVAQALHVQSSLNAQPLITVQNPYSLLNRTLEDEMFPFVNATDVGIMAYSPLAVGLLSGAYTPDTIPDDSSLWGSRRRGIFGNVLRGRASSVLGAVREVAAETGASVAQVAQAWVLSHDEITVLISGADTSKQMSENLGALEVQLSAEHRQKLDDVSRGLRMVLDGSDFEADR